MNRMSRMTLGSLFDGIAGFPLAGLKAGIRTLWLSEIEPFPVRVTEKRFPDALQLGDVHGISGSGIQPVDIITFGSPCTDLSIAGHQAGLQGSQSSLFYEAVRIIREMRNATDHQYPRWAVWENVPNALSCHSGQDFREVLRALVRIADEDADVPMPETGRWLPAGEILGDGYSLAWRILDASKGWGVAQRRKRVFLVLDLGGACAGKILFESEGLSGFAPPGSAARKGDPGSPEGGAHASGFCTEHSADSRGIGYAEEESPTLRAGVIPAVALNFNPTDARLKFSRDGVCQTLTARAGTGGVNVPLVGQPVAYGVGAFNSEGMLPGPPRSECSGSVTSRMPDHNGGSQVSQRGDMAAVQTIQKKAVAMNVGLLNSGDNVSPPILARDFKDPPIVTEPEYLVRRLTPLECLRLQGYPDGWLRGLGTENPAEEEISRWTQVFAVWNCMQGKKPRTRNQIIKWLRHPNTDAAEYKAIGNSVAIPCVHFILAGSVWAAGEENENEKVLELDPE